MHGFDEHRKSWYVISVHERLEGVEKPMNTNSLGLFEKVARILVLSVISGNAWNASGYAFVQLASIKWEVFKPDMIVFDSLRDNCSFRPFQRYHRSESIYLLEPMLTIALAGGPMKTMPSFPSCSANLAFSLKKPYL